MTKEERQGAILDSLMKSGSAQVTELSASLQVSSVTIRKDLTELEKEGKLYRSHGKAIYIYPFGCNQPASEDEIPYSDEKLAIGREAAKLIGKDDSIVLASGTTVHALAQCIYSSDKLTVVTSSLQVTETLALRDNIEVIQLGGMVRPHSLSVVGKYSESLLQNLSLSKLFLGVDGIDFDYGITTPDLREATLNRKMMQAAQQTIVLADSSKFGRRGFAKICNVDDIDMLVTDNKIPASARRWLEENGIELIVAGECPG